MVARGVRKSCAMTPMVSSVALSWSRRRLEEDIPSSTASAQQKASTTGTTTASSGRIAGPGGARLWNISQATRMPPAAPAVAIRHSVSW